MHPWSFYFLFALWIPAIVTQSCDRCTLAAFCWLSGGRAEAGCGGPSWFMTCCSHQITRTEFNNHPPHPLDYRPPRPHGLRSSVTSLELVNNELDAEAERNDVFLFGTNSRIFQPLNTEGLQIRPLTRFKPSQVGLGVPAPDHRLWTRLKIQNSNNLVPYSPSAPVPPQQQQQQGPPPNRINQVLTSQPAVCGVQPLRLFGFSKRIIGGEQATFGEFPWQAHIRIAGFQCGGVLLNHQYVATAAHCVHRAKLSQIIVYLGEYDTKDTDLEILPRETLGVIERKIHPNFKYMLTQPDRFDVALLKLSRPVNYRDNILPICLPPENKNYEGYTGVVAGWGKTDTSFGKTGTNVLNKVYVPIINNDKCYRWHASKEIILELHNEMFCAGHQEGKRDACLGDSGGPLVVKDQGRWNLVGITSAGFGCAVDHQPGIYHKVSHTVTWILANIIN